MWMIGCITGWIWGLTALTLVSSAPHSDVLQNIGISLLYVPAVFASTIIHPFTPPDYVAMNNYIVWITIPLSGGLICAVFGYAFEKIHMQLCEQE
jgi:hypothetical protein